MWHSAEAKEAVTKLMIGAVPERTKEIKARWEKYSPEVWIVP